VTAPAPTKTIGLSPSRWVDRMRRSRELEGALAQLAARRRADLGNVIGASAALVAAAALEGQSAPALIVTASPEEARALAADLTFFAPALTVRVLSTLEEGATMDGGGATAFGARLDVVQSLRSGVRGLAVLASVAALLEPLPAADAIDRSTLTLRAGQALDRDDLVARLAAAGFERTAIVETPGQFAVRGAIVDVFDPAATYPTRIELDADGIESMRRFEPASQMSIEQISSVTLALLTKDAAPGREAGDHGGAVGEPLDSFLEDASIVILRDPTDIAAAVARHLEQEELATGTGARAAFEPYLRRPVLALSRLPIAAVGVSFDMGSIEARGGEIDAALETLTALVRASDEVVICFANAAERDRFWESIEERKSEALARAHQGGVVVDVLHTAWRGFRWRDARRALVNHRELFDIVVHRRALAPRPNVKARAIDDFVDLKEGDYVVHVAHGVAKFIALERMQKGGEEQDFFTLEFRDQVRVYVPVAKADLIQKYIGGKGDAPELSRLGGRSWANKKAAVFRAVSDLAVELLETHAIREREEGIQHPPDTPWQHEFEAAFPYEETPDQLAAIEAIRADMESPRPMDRLVCGDVGYGKTEVAMRAVFKAVMSGKQAAVLVPTTVLAEQHAITFAERMSGYPVRVECLSRFKTRGEQSQTLIGTAEGTVDVVIGTHRILSEDVGFKDLGLLVIDEEQRFGVAHKQRLRSLRRHVDVLTLTATPIPRTLHLSLLGIRDISSLTQAPAARQPVETKIVPFDAKLVRAAVLHELERGGQCFFVHNRVQSIERIKKELKAIVPEARLVVAHGQMKEHEIEANMRAFVRREADVLLATTIIESGLDIPNANTIFIDRPEMYGLADLHQLRGRVGRYREKAYAYLLLRPDSLPTGEAEKRLRAIEEFTDLGSGFRIAMRDLEIRGAGNILGAEQSGHISAVGYEMYCRLLDAAVKKLKREQVVLPDEVELNLNFDASLPKDFIPDQRAQLEMYRKLGRAQTNEDFDMIVEELRDRFGPSPKPAADFVVICRIRAVLERHRIRSIGITPQGVLLRPAILKSLRQRLEVSRTEHRVIASRDVVIVHSGPLDDPARVLDVLRAALQHK
jgi:transcription-repair coupling factor (superfamily II helicase)